MWPTESTVTPPPPEPPHSQPLVFGLNFKIPIYVELFIPEDIDFGEILKNGIQNMCSGEFPEGFPDFSDLSFPCQCSCQPAAINSTQE